MQNLRLFPDDNQHSTLAYCRNALPLTRTLPAAAVAPCVGSALLSALHVFTCTATQREPRPSATHIERFGVSKYGVCEPCIPDTRLWSAAGQTSFRL